MQMSVPVIPSQLLSELGRKIAEFQLPQFIDMLGK